jgi:peptidoglycan/LPS O-acetylase OafA/YrhL
VTTPPDLTERRHDLDALRAIAMLLGIALHAALSFLIVPWPVRDSDPTEWLGLLVFALHGFRMPLFFLLSGFFTAMLWRKRGLRSLLGHRFKRIFIPFVLGCLTVVPLSNWVIGRAIATGAGGGGGATGLWEAAATGDLDAARALLAADPDLGAHDSGMGQTPLGMAALYGRAEMAALLIEHGADVDGANRDGGRPLHNAAFLGHDDVVRVLIDNGVDTESVNGTGQKAIEVIFTDWETTEFIADLVRYDFDHERILAGRMATARRLGGEETAAFLDRVLSGDAGATETRTLGDVLRESQHAPILHHLWFLWFLCLLVAAFAPFAAVLDALGVGRLPRRLIVSPLRYAWLIPLTMVPQWFTGRLMPVFGPDTSAGIVPMPHVLLYYAVFYFFGAAYYDTHDDAGRLGSWWFATLPLAVVLFPFGLGLAFAGPEIQERIGVPGQLLGDALQVTYTWLMVFGLMGLFRRLLRREHPRMRYLSDASYWLYIAHLPLIIAAQVWVRDWPLPGFVKFLLICGVATVFLLLTYRLFVRYTPVGTLLNGRRRRPAESTG